MKQPIFLLTLLLLFNSARCSAGVPLPGDPVPTNLPQQTIIPVTETGRPTREPTSQATLLPLATLTPIFQTFEETVEPTGSLPNLLTITIVYDNIPFEEGLKTAWGFAALVEYQDRSLLFDTGGDGPTLIENMSVLGIDPGRIDTLVLSHIHNDHTGGLNDLLECGTQPVVYLPPSFPPSFKSPLSQKTDVVEAAPGQMINGGIFTTGELNGKTVEQALVIRIDQGLVIITGCSHPGIVKIVERASSLFSGPVYLVMGGFHLNEKNENEIRSILSDFRRLDVHQVAPSHCTGAQALAMFASEYGEKFIQSGLGKKIQLNSPVR